MAKRSRGKMLLVATLGAATITLAGCSDGFTSGNLIAPPPCTSNCDVGSDTGTDTTADTPQDAGPDAATDTASQ